MSRDTTSSTNGSDVLAGLPRTRPQRPSARRGAVVDKPGPTGEAPEAAVSSRYAKTAKPKTPKASGSGAPKASGSGAPKASGSGPPKRDSAGAKAASGGAAATPGAPSAPVVPDGMKETAATDGAKAKPGGIPTPARVVSDALHAVDELRARGEQTLKSALSRLRRG